MTTHTPKFREAVLNASELSNRFPVAVHVCEVRRVGCGRPVGYALFVTQVPVSDETGEFLYTAQGTFQCGRLVEGGAA